MLAIISQLGGPAALARQLGVAPQAVSQWRSVPSERVIAVARISRWSVTPHQLRPDLYPHPDDGLPDNLRRQVAGCG